MTRRPTLVRQPAPPQRVIDDNDDVGELFIADPPQYTIVIDRSGGHPLANHTMAEAVKLLRAWWRPHRDRYVAELEADRRRRHMREGDQS